MRINGDGENLLGVVLADHMAVKLGDDFTRFHRCIPRREFTADGKAAEIGSNNPTAIVKAAPKLRQHFCPFLRVDRNSSHHLAPPSFRHVNIGRMR
jgi:hypothetical protein